MSETTRRIDREEVQEAIDLLEAIAKDVRLLETLPEGQAVRLRRAARRVAHPDRTTRRRLQKENRSAHKPAKLRKTEENRHDTGIRTLRRKPVFTTPNYFPPPPGEDEPPREAGERQDCDL